MPYPAQKAFTLAELLIALAILGVIATFAIPKVLQSQQDNKYKAMAKETASMLSEAFQNVKLKQGISAATKTTDLAAYFNYVKKDNTLIIDDDVGGAWDCSTSNNDCLVLHNGGVLNYQRTASFGGTTPDRVMWFMLDPDGKTNSTYSLTFSVFLNGRIIDLGNTPGTVCTYTGSADYCYSSSPNPPWFNWN